MSFLETIFLIPLSHMDWAWGNTRKKVIHRNNQIIFATLEILEAEEDYKFEGFHEVHIIEDFWNRYPQFREKWRNFVQEGRIDNLGSPFCSPCPPYLEEDILIRAILYGKQFYKELFGEYEDLTLAFHDVPMLFAQIPQIASKFGFKYYEHMNHNHEALFAKGIPSQFIWESPDGSRILCHHAPLYYVGFLGFGDLYSSRPSRFEEIAGTLKKQVDCLEKSSLTKVLHFHYGGDWGSPVLNLTEFVKYWNKKYSKPKLVIATSTEYFKELDKEENLLPVFSGNLDPISWNAMYGNSGEKGNQNLRRTVNKILTTERLLSLVSTLSEEIAYPSEDFVASWAKVFVPYSHGGSYITYAVYEEDLEQIERDLRETEKKMDAYTTNSIESLTRPGKNLFIFNPLGWEREGWVELLDKAFWVKVPPLGFTFVLGQVDGYREVEVTENRVENEYLRLGFAKGRLVSIYDKEADKEVLLNSQCSGGEVLVDEGYVGDIEAWFGSTSRLDYIAYSEISKKGHKATVKLRAKFRENLIEQMVTLYAGQRGVHFQTRIVNKDENLRYRIAFPFAAKGNIRLFSDEPFFIGERELEKEPLVGRTRSWTMQYPCTKSQQFPSLRAGENKGVFYGLNFALLEDQKYSLALFNRGTVGYQRTNNVLSNILLSSKDSLDWGSGQPYMGICPYRFGTGEYTFENVLYPHPKGPHGNILKKSLEFNFPLLIKDSLRSSFSKRLSLLRLSPESIILSALYTKGEYLWLRIYEVAGKRTYGRLKFLKGVEEAAEVNFLEQDITALNPKGSTVPVDFKPYEIKEIKVRLRGRKPR